MRRLLLLTLLIPVWGLTGPASGASAAPRGCPEPKPLAQELTTASVVFEGEIRRSEKQGDQRVSYEVKIARIYRGEGLVKRVTVTAPATKADCGLPGVEKGQRWMFLSRSEMNEPLATSTSDGTTEATGKVVREVESILGPGVKPSTEPEPPVTAELTNVADGGPEDFWPISLPGFALVVIGLVVLAAARGLSRRAERHASSN